MLNYINVESLFYYFKSEKEYKSYSFLKWFQFVSLNQWNKKILNKTRQIF